MAENKTPRQSRPRPIGVATALMCALAGGAVWCIVSMYARSELPGFAFVVAGFVVWALRAHGYAARPSGVFVAVLSVALAASYAFYLQAIAQVAALLGLTMRSVLGQMGAGMALDIVRANAQGWNLLVISIAAVAAGAAMLWKKSLGRE
jgi:hypothetical protein